MRAGISGAGDPTLPDSPDSEGCSPFNPATRFSAAIMHIFSRVSRDALAMCGARTTLFRSSNAGSISGSRSKTSRPAASNLS